MLTILGQQISRWFFKNYQLYKSNKQSLPVLKGGSVAAVAAAVAAAIAARVMVGVRIPLLGLIRGTLTGSGGGSGALTGSGAGGAQKLGIS